MDDFGTRLKDTEHPADDRDGCESSKIKSMNIDNILNPHVNKGEVKMSEKIDRAVYNFTEKCMEKIIIRRKSFFYKFW